MTAVWVSFICTRDGNWNRIPTHGAVRAASCTLQYSNEPDSSRLPGSAQEQHEAVAQGVTQMCTVIADFRDKSIQADTSECHEISLLYSIAWLLGRKCNTVRVAIWSWRMCIRARRKH